MSKRLYSVRVTCEIDMPVLASSDEEAAKIALENYTEEFAWERSVEASPVELLMPAAALPAAFRGAIPWGSDGDVTCDEIMRRREATDGE